MHECKRQSMDFDKPSNSSTPVFIRNRIFSTPNVPPKTKVKPGFSPGFSPAGPSTTNNFVTPDMSRLPLKNAEKRVTLSHPLDDSFCIERQKTIRVKFDLDYQGYGEPSKIFWKLIQSVTGKDELIKLGCP